MKFCNERNTASNIYHFSIAKCYFHSQKKDRIMQCQFVIVTNQAIKEGSLSSHFLFFGWSQLQITESTTGLLSTASRTHSSKFSSGSEVNMPPFPVIRRQRNHPKYSGFEDDTKKNIGQSRADS